MTTEEINLNDDSELNLPNHRFTAQALEMDKPELTASILSQNNADMSVNMEIF